MFVKFEAIREGTIYANSGAIVCIRIIKPQHREGNKYAFVTMSNCSYALEEKEAQKLIRILEGLPREEEPSRWEMMTEDE